MREPVLRIALRLHHALRIRAAQENKTLFDLTNEIMAKYLEVPLEDLVPRPRRIFGEEVSLQDDDKRALRGL